MHLMILTVLIIGSVRGLGFGVWGLGFGYRASSDLKIRSRELDFTFLSRNMKGSPGRHAELHAGHPGPVLAPVVLLLHQEKQLRKAPRGVPYFSS